MMSDDGEFFREIEDNCWNPEKRIQEMTATGWLLRAGALAGLIAAPRGGCASHLHCTCHVQLLGEFFVA
jgi:hypothetical protein